ncbi:MAG: acetolactate synthase small subunit [Pontiellaceae bacterium]|jgi:acetolactate synthase-1/3 small subunit|nr:acetolactate synthase small subunit [Pontiellaceae bacterium]
MISNKKIHTLSVYVANKPGVLARIAQTFSRRGYNIESLVVSPAMDGHFSRMTIGVSGAANGLAQIIQQVSKLIDVLHCTDHTFDDAVVKEMGLIKISVDSSGRGEALQIAEHFGCKTVDLTETSMILQVVGDPAKIDALVEMIEKFKIIELVRTGKVLLARGAETT